MGKRDAVGCGQYLDGASFAPPVATGGADMWGHVRPGQGVELGVQGGRTGCSSR